MILVKMVPAFFVLYMRDNQELHLEHLDLQAGSAYFFEQLSEA